MTALHQAAQKAVEAPSDEEIATWVDSFIRKQAYNYPVAVQIATEAAKWVRSRTAPPALQEVPREPDLTCVCGAVWERGANEWEMVHSPRAVSPSTPAREEAGLPAVDSQTNPPADGGGHG